MITRTFACGSLLISCFALCLVYGSRQSTWAPRVSAATPVSVAGYFPTLLLQDRQQVDPERIWILGDEPPPEGPTLECPAPTQLQDSLTPADCIQASATPTLGLLYPLSNDHFVSSTGDVGLGTLLPAAKLHVIGESVFQSDNGARSWLPFTDGTAIITGDLQQGVGNIEFRTYDGAYTDRMIIRGDSGRVGIGTYSPIARLHVAGDTALFETTSGARTWLPYTTGTVYITGDATGPLDGDIKFRTYNGAYTDRMIIRADSGRVGIGTTIPDAKLQVVGETHLQSLTVDEQILVQNESFPRVFDVTTFGADGTDNLDDSDALAAAVQAALTSPTGGVVYFPHGTYDYKGVYDVNGRSCMLVDKAVYPNARIAFVGDGQMSILRKNDAGGTGIDIRGIAKNETGRVNAPTIERLRMISKDGVTQSGNSKFIWLYRTTHATIRDVQMEDPYEGIHIEGSFDTRVFNCRITRAGLCGMRVDALANDTVDTHLANILTNGGAPDSRSLLIQGWVSGLYAVNCDFAQGGTGILIRETPGIAPPEFLFFTQVFVDQTSGPGWKIESGKTIVLTSCWAGTTGMHGLWSTAGQDIRMVNFSALNIAGDGARFEASTGDVSIIGGNFRGKITLEGKPKVPVYYGDNGIFVGAISGDVQISDCLIEDFEFDGILVQSGKSDFSIKNVRARNNLGYGVGIAPGTSDRYIIEGCRLYGNTAGGLGDGGTGFFKIIAHNLY